MHGWHRPLAASRGIPAGADLAYGRSLGLSSPSLVLRNAAYCARLHIAKEGIIVGTGYTEQTFPTPTTKRRQIGWKSHESLQTQQLCHLFLPSIAMQ
eukprot:scaffold19941_cov14-Tisochrysis_lutea.AAC.1